MKNEKHFLEFKDEDGRNYIISFPILNQEKNQRLRLWVCYERGNSVAMYDYRFLYRGFYLYISLGGTWECGATVQESKYNRRIFLGEVQRKSERAYRDFAEKAGWYAREMVEKYCDDLELDWNNGYASQWSGNEADFGMWREEYQITHYW